MAQLPPDGQFLIQQIDGMVHIFEQGSDWTLHTFDPSDADATAKKLNAIYHDVRLTDEQRCFAVFWSGYFYAHAGMGD